MGKNKLAKFAEMETFPHVFQMSSNAILSGETFSKKGTWNSSFFGNSNPIVLELGCGKGEYTVNLAKLFPDKNFIGVDIKGARIWSGAKQSLEGQMTNVAFIRANIEMIHHFFAHNEVAEIWLTFPDPQMKKVNKRLTSTNFMSLYQRFLKSDGLIHLKTDSNFMYTYTCEMVKENSFTVQENINDLYSQQNIEPVLQIKTYYEQQWLERGLTIKYIRFQLDHRNKYVEPDVEIEHDSYRSFGRSKRQHLS
jgi:tRNA (guanine-N7-)-methyltransferase